MDARPIANSYMVTNRADPSAWFDSGDICPLPPGENIYFIAAGVANNAYSDQYNPVSDATAAMPSFFQNQLDTDIANAVANGGPQVTLMIHGLSYYFDDACYTLGTFGQNLVNQGYDGLVIGFSWPSYGPFDSTEYYGGLPYSFPPAADSGTIRDNINGSTQSLLALLSQLVPLCRTHDARLNIVCHSEGNYMLMLAMHALSLVPDRSELTPRFIDQVLMVAADINNAALQSPSSAPAGAGQGAPIGRFANAVTIYSSAYDDLLPWSEGWTDYHNPSFPNRLGLFGPNSNAKGAFLTNACALDCSDVANKSNPWIPRTISVHESYFYIPQILLDMAQTLADTPPADVDNRVGAGNQSFKMKSVTVPEQPPFRPRGTRLANKARVKA